MSVLHIVIDHAPSAGHSDGVFALAGAFLVGILALAGQILQARRDRNRAEVDALRDLLGDASEALGAARKSYIRLAPYLSNVSKTERQEAAEGEQREATTATRNALDRLRVFLPPGHEIMTAYERASVTLDLMSDHYRNGASTGTFKEVGDILGVQMDEFTALARKRVSKLG